MLIVRSTYKELMNNHVIYLRPMLKDIARFNKTDMKFTFGNGSTITFGYCAGDGDLDQYQGAEFDVIFYDEATNLREEWIKKINACVRGVNDFPKRCYYTCNPGGVSMDYFRRLFVDKKYQGKEKPEDYNFVQALVYDNKALMQMQPEYLDELENLPPKLRAAWLEGRWDIYEGQFFEDFRPTPDLDLCVRAGITPDQAIEQRRFTHVIPPFDISKGACKGWKIMRSYDFGYNRPYSMAYWAMDYDGVLYRILEVYGCTGEPNEGTKQTPEEQFAYFEELENTHPWLKGRKIVDSVADPAIWEKSHGVSIAETAEKHGIYFDKGDNHRVPGWMQVHYRLQFDEHGYPRMYFFDNCKAIIRTMPMMLYNAHKPEDLDTELEDHCCDELRYICMANCVAPMRTVQRKTYLTDPLNQLGGY